MIKLGVVMDPIDSIKIKKDSTFAMLLEAQARQYSLFYMQLNDLYTYDGEAYSAMRSIKVKDDANGWFELGEKTDQSLAALDVVLMRKDPPFDMEYIYATYILELAEIKHNVLVINKPQSLRDFNEKLATTWFPQCMPPTLVTRSANQINLFLQNHKDIILKPLDGMGGTSIFRVRLGDVNTNVIIETLTRQQQRYIMVQRFVPEIEQGDKRILLVDGEPVPYALARIPAKGESRGNLAVGGKGVGVELTERDYWICEQVAPALKQKGLVFVGIDVIGAFLTEINVTSPTCIRELDALYNLNISGTLMDNIEAKCKQKPK